VIISGRTSTVKNVKIVAVGDHIPKSYSGARLKNTSGFSWWVSEHYALKTDYPEKQAHFYLTLLELAYPHYVALFGREPPGIQSTRMAVVYASSTAQLKKALASDGLSWDFAGGGITYEGYNCGYQYPSGSLQYHQRYILLHECTHLFQMCLNGNLFSTPGWYIEGIADAFGAHVYDSGRQQLTVNVLDKATIINHYDEALTRLRRGPASIEKINQDGSASREVAFLLIHFFNDDPERAQKFRIWRDEMFRLNRYGKYHADSGRLLQELFGPWKQLDADFARWVADRHNTFHYLEWGWEQEGNTLWSYGFAERGALSQTDVLLPPGEKPSYEPLRMDYPAEPAPGLVGPVARGVAEPVIGCVIDFSRNPQKGWAGLGLGAGNDPEKEPGFLKVLVHASRELNLDGTDLGLAKKTEALPQEVRRAMAAGRHRVGLTVKIGRQALLVTLRAQASTAVRPAKFTTSLPLTETARQRLLTRPLTILARDGYHGVTPFFDDRRRPLPNLLVPAPANRWRNPGDAQLYAVCKACWRLGKEAPASLRALRATLLEAADKEPVVQQAALAAWRKHLPQVKEDIRLGGAKTERAEQALLDLVQLVR
jgi:hypothetical protein